MHGNPFCAPVKSVDKLHLNARSGHVNKHPYTLDFPGSRKLALTLLCLGETYTGFSIMLKSVSIAGVVFASLAFVLPARASQIGFGFSGAGYSGNGSFTYVPDVSPPDPDPLCGSDGDSCRADPAGAYAITGITGTFSDATDGISDATITGLVPISPVNEHDPIFDPLVPTSLSYVGPLSYDNLFFPNGNPFDCDFPYDGTYFDVFGVAFTLSNGDTAVLWGDGIRPADGPVPLFDANGNLIVGPTYGLGVLNSDDVELSSAFSGVNAAVPEPSSIALLLAGLAMIGGAFYFGRKKAMAS